MLRFIKSFFKKTHEPQPAPEAPYKVEAAPAPSPIVVEGIPAHIAVEGAGIVTKLDPVVLDLGTMAVVAPLAEVKVKPEVKKAPAKKTTVAPRAKKPVAVKPAVEKKPRAKKPTK